MGDSSTLSGLAVSASGRQPTIYDSAREVNFRAKATQRADSPVHERAFSRLDNVLATKKPLARDVPRGFYLNILV